MRLAVPALLLAACSSSSQGGAPADAGGDAMIDASADAAGDAEQDPNVYPAKHHPMPLAQNAGGAVLYDLKIVTVTFVGDAFRDPLRAFDDSVVSSAWWRAVAAEYHVDPGTSGGYAELPDTVSGKVLDNNASIKPLIQNAITSGKLPSPDASTLYVIYFPASTTLGLQGQASCVSFVGFHDSFAASTDAGTVTVSYAAIARCSTAFDDLTYTASHEAIEAATDAHPSADSAWYIAGNNAWTGPGGGELADICVGRGAAYPIDDAGAGLSSLARSWSNAAAKMSHDPCQPSDPSRVFFAAAVDTTLATVSDSLGTHRTDGYLTVTRGDTTTANVTVFSEAPLPSDVSLLVGARTASSDPTVLQPIANGVTASLSRGAAHNGNAATLTLSATASASPGDYPFVVRAILTPTDYHSWPVVLRVE